MGSTVPGRLYRTTLLTMPASGAKPWIAVAADTVYCGYLDAPEVELRMPDSLALLRIVAWPALQGSDVREAGTRLAAVVSDGRCLVQVIERAVGPSGGADPTSIGFDLHTFTLHPEPVHCRSATVAPSTELAKGWRDSNLMMWTDGYLLHAIAVRADAQRPPYAAHTNRTPASGYGVNEISITAFSPAYVGMAANTRAARVLLEASLGPPRSRPRAGTFGP